MRLGQVIASIGGTALVIGGVAAGAPATIAIAAGIAIGTLAGVNVVAAKEGRRKYFDQENLQQQEADKTVAVYCEQKKQPTVGVLKDGKLEQVPAEQFCDIKRGIMQRVIVISRTIDVRYSSAISRCGSGYYCLADGAKELEGVYDGNKIPCTPKVPSTDRLPKAYSMCDNPFGQTFPEFQAECQAVVDYCGNR